MSGNSELDRLADTGVAGFIMNNSSGKYLPGLAGSLAGFAKGTAIRLIFNYSGNEYKRFYGSIDDIYPYVKGYPGSEGDKVSVTVTDWMDYAATHPLLTPAVGTNKRGDEMITTLLAALPIAPLNTDLDTGVNTFPLSFDAVTIKTKAYSELSKIALSELGYIYLIKDPVYGETLVFENADARNGLRTPDFVIDNSMTSLEVDYGKNVINRFGNIAYPRKTAVALEVLFSLDSPLAVNTGATLIFRGSYKDPSGGSPIAGTGMVAPVVTTDYLMNANAAGTGANLSANFTVVANYYAAFVEYELTNNTYTGYVTKLQARGYAIRSYNSIESAVEDSDSVDEFDYQEVKLQQRYKQDIYRGIVLGAEVVEQERRPRKRLNKAHFIANRTDALMTNFLTRDVGMLANIIEDKTELDIYYYIQGVTFNISPGGLIKYAWILKEMQSLNSGLSLITAEFTKDTTDALDYGYLESVYSDTTGDLYSFSCWIYVDAMPTAATYGVPMCFSIDGADLVLQVFSTGELSIYSVIWDTTPGWWTTAAGAITAGSWIHIAMTYDLSVVANDPILYKNAVAPALNEASTPAGAKFDRIGAKVMLGNYKTSVVNYEDSFGGKIKDARIFHKILTPAEVTTLAGGGDVTDSLVFQGPCVRTEDLAYFEDLTLAADDRLLENIAGAVGVPNNTVVTRLIP